MKIKSLLCLKHSAVSTDTSIEKVWKMLARRDITLVPVVDQHNNLIGVIGEDDLLYPLVPDYREYFSEFYPDSPNLTDLEDKLEQEISLTAEDVMNKKVVSVNENHEVFKALSRMMSYRVRAMPVVDDKGRFKGMIIEDDIMSYLFKHHQYLIKKKKIVKSYRL